MKVESEGKKRQKVGEIVEIESKEVCFVWRQRERSGGGLQEKG